MIRVVVRFRRPAGRYLSGFRVLVACAATVATWGAAAADGTVTGRVRFERVKGSPQLGHVELFETNLFLSPDGGTSRGPSFRVGSPPGQVPRGDGFYSLTVPAGTWSALVSQPLFFIRPKVVADITVGDNQTTRQNINLNIDYSTAFTDTWTTFGSVWIQTFRSTGTAISGISFKLAGTNADQIEVSLLRDDGSPDPSGWPLATAAARKSTAAAALADRWVRWRSGAVTTVPGNRYAVRLRGVAGGDRKFAVFHRLKDADSYALGRAYDGAGRPQDFDLNVTVFSDNDETAILYSKTTEGLGELRDGFFGGRWGQTFRATRGTSLAAVDVWAAGANNNWDLDFTFRVLKEGPGGPQVGPAKTTRAAFQAFGAGLHGVSFNPGEVPLEAGETYYIEFTNPEGFNPYVFNDGADAYAEGTGFQDRSARPADLSMTIIAYTRSGGHIAGRVTEASSGAPLTNATVRVVEVGRSASTDADGSYQLRDIPPGTYTLEATKTGFTTASADAVTVVNGETTTVHLQLALRPCAVSFVNPSFEQSLTGWTRYGDARNDTESGPWFADIVAADGTRFHGNAINGGILERGGLWQQACAVPGHRYRVSLWSNVYWIGGSSSGAENRVGIDPGGGTDPNGQVVWSAAHRQPQRATAQWRQIFVEAEATAPVLTVFADFRQRGPDADWRINCFDLVEIEDLDAQPEPVFRRANCDGSSSDDISDPIFLLNHLFAGGPRPQCPDACDVNDDGSHDISDAIYLLAYLFGGGAAPPPPGQTCGPDPTADDLDCAMSDCAAR